MAALSGYQISGIICCLVSLLASISIFFYFFCIRIRKLNQSLYNKVILGLILCQVLSSVHFMLNLITVNQHGQIGYYSSYLCQVDGFLATFILYMIMLYNYQLSHAIQAMYDQFNPSKVKAADYHLSAVIVSLVLTVITIPLSDIGRTVRFQDSNFNQPFNTCGIMMGSISEYIFSYVAILVLIYCIYSLLRIANVLIYDKTILRKLRDDMQYHIMNVIMYIIVWFQFAVVNLSVFLNKGFNSTPADNNWIRAASYFAYLAGFLSSALRMGTDPRLTAAYAKLKCCQSCYKKRKAAAASDPQIFQNNVTVLAGMLFSIIRIYNSYSKNPQFSDCVHQLDKELPENFDQTAQYIADEVHNNQMLPDTSSNGFPMNEIHCIVTEHQPHYLHRLRLNDSLTLDFFNDSLLPSKNSDILSKFLKTQSKGGQDLIVTQNLKLIIKTVSPAQKILLLDKNFLRYYTKYLQQNPQSMLIKKYGLFSFEFQGKKFSSIIMQNVGAIPKDLLLLKFDLKFSRRNRSVLKQRDFRLLPGYLLNKSGVSLFQQKLVKNIYQFGADSNYFSKLKSKRSNNNSLESYQKRRLFNQSFQSSSSTYNKRRNTLNQTIDSEIQTHQHVNIPNILLNGQESSQNSKTQSYSESNSQYRPPSLLQPKLCNLNRESTNSSSSNSQDTKKIIQDDEDDEDSTPLHRNSLKQFNINQTCMTDNNSLLISQRETQRSRQDSFHKRINEIKNTQKFTTQQTINSEHRNYAKLGIPLSAIDKYNQYYDTLLEEEQSVLNSNRQTTKTYISSMIPGQIWRHARNYKPSVMKDKDFQKIFNLRIRKKDLELFAKMVRQVKKDCDFLQKNNLLDYSILIFVARVPSPSEGQKYKLFQQELISLQQNNRFYFYSPSEKFVYFMAIIDFLGSFDYKKKGQAGFKALIADDKDDPSAVHPHKYKERFIQGMEKLQKFVESEYEDDLEEEDDDEDDEDASFNGVNGGIDENYEL